MDYNEHRAKELKRIAIKVERLKTAHKEKSKTDSIKHLTGKMDASEYEQRFSARLSEIDSLEDTQTQIDLANLKAQRAETRHKQKLRLQRFYNLYSYIFPHYNDFTLTDGQKAVLIALMKKGQGSNEICTAKEYIAKIAGVSERTVQSALHYLARHGVLSITERRKPGEPMNYWNIYRIKCEALLRWAKHHFISNRGEADCAHRGINLFITTDQEKKDPKPKQEAAEKNNCRQKAGRYEVFAGPEATDEETFVLVAKAGLEKLGRTAPDKAGAGELIEILDQFRAEKLPNLKPWAWNTGRMKHGERKPRLAFLELMLLTDARKRLDCDNSPWNEREMIRNPPAYLASLLYRDPVDCKPELTIATLLAPFSIYDLPSDLLRAAKSRIKARGKLKRSDSSVSLA